jgi:hypothetical protein
VIRTDGSEFPEAFPCSRRTEAVLAHPPPDIPPVASVTTEVTGRITATPGVTDDPTVVLDATPAVSDRVPSGSPYVCGVLFHIASGFSNVSAEPPRATDEIPPSSGQSRRNASGFPYASPVLPWSAAASGRAERGTGRRASGFPYSSTVPDRSGAFSGRAALATARLASGTSYMMAQRCRLAEPRAGCERSTLRIATASPNLSAPSPRPGASP